MPPRPVCSSSLHITDDATHVSYTQGRMHQLSSQLGRLLLFLSRSHSLSSPSPGGPQYLADLGREMRLSCASPNEAEGASALAGRPGPGGERARRGLMTSTTRLHRIRQYSRRPPLASQCPEWSDFDYAARNRSTGMSVNRQGPAFSHCFSASPASPGSLLLLYSCTHPPA
jgi:hypothetical protein